MGNAAMNSLASGETHMARVARSCTVDLPAMQRELVLERVGRRLPREGAVTDSRLVQIVIEEALFVEACM